MPGFAAAGGLTMVRVDAYRLGGVAGIDDFDLDAALEESVTVVEWGGGLADRLADAHLEIRLSRTDDSRTAELVPSGGSRPQLGAALVGQERSDDDLGIADGDDE